MHVIDLCQDPLWDLPEDTHQGELLEKGASAGIAVKRDITHHNAPTLSEKRDTHPYVGTVVRKDTYQKSAQTHQSPR